MVSLGGVGHGELSEGFFKLTHIIEIEPGKNLPVENHTDIHIRDDATIHVISVIK